MADPENIGIAVEIALPSSVETEIIVLPYPLPVVYIVWGIQKTNAWPFYVAYISFKHTYLYSKEFFLETDHQPLQYLQKAKFQNDRLNDEMNVDLADVYFLPFMR